MFELSENIVTGQTEIAANLDQLRYLVIRGIDGRSAYDVAVSLGFEGTEQEWLDSLIGPQGPEGKNYGFQIDTDTELDGIIIQDPEMTVVKSVNGQSGAVTITADGLGAMKAASYAGANYPPMDDASANELVDCICSYIDNADMLFYSGMNAKYFPVCTDPATVRDAIKDIVDIPEGAALAEIKEIVDALTDSEINSIRIALHLGGRHAMNAPREVVDYLLSGRKPIHCAWFAYLVSSGIRYETSLYTGNETYSRFYDWGFDWRGFESYFDEAYTDIAADGQPLANKMAKYCMENGYGFKPNGDFSKLRTGDLMFFANSDSDVYEHIGHVAVFLYHSADGERCTVADVSSEAPDGTNTTYPIQVKILSYDSTFMQKCTIAARLPYACSGRVSQPKNLFSNEVACRDLAKTLAASSAVFARGSFSDSLTLNRFYSFVICLDRAPGIGDVIRLQGDTKPSSTVIAENMGAVPDHRGDGVYCMTLFNGRYRSPSYAMFERLGGSGIIFRSAIPGGGGGTGVAQEATVKWIACYEGVHHVGRNGFIPYDNVLDLAAALATLPAPVITEQPQDTTIARTESAVFAVSAAGYGLRYRWQYKTKPSDDWTNCSSATQGYNTDTLTVQGAKDTGTRNGYQYRCGIVDANGKTTFSDGATLTVEVS